MNGTDASSMPEDTPTTPFPAAVERKRRARRRRSPLERFRNEFTKIFEPLLTALLGLVIVGSLLAVGTVHVQSLLVVASATFLATAVALFIEEDWKRSVPPPAWVLVGLSLYTLLQSIPLRWNWLIHLSKLSAQTWADARSLLGSNAHRAASISTDPGATRVEALKWLCYAALFTSVACLTKRKGAKRGIGLVIIAALTGGVLTILHGLLGLDKWLWLYKPSFSGPPWAMSPLLNANNYAGYLNLAAFCSIGLAMTGRPPGPRWALGLVSAILVALSFLTGSRGGALALLLGTLLVTLALREQASRARRKGAPVLPSWLPLVGIVVVGGTLFLLGSNRVIWDQLLDETTSKLRIVEWTGPMIAAHRWFGVGRGAYETASAAYRTTPGLYVYQHAENFIADWLAEWGIPVTIAGLLSLTWLLRPRRLGFLRHPIPTASLIGVLALLLQNLVDLGLEVASVGIALFAVLAALWGGATRDRERRATRDAQKTARNDDPSSAPEFQSGPIHESPAHLTQDVKEVFNSPRVKNARQIARRALVRAGGWLAASTAFILFVGVTGQPDSDDTRRQLHDAFSSIKWSNHSEVEHFSRRLATAIEHHPADPYLPLLGAQVARNTGKNPLVWLNQVLRRDPLNARAELLLADVLVARGHVHQALGALKRCATNEPELNGVVAERAIKFTQSLDELELALPDGPGGVTVLDSLALRASKPEQRPLHDALLERALQRQPDSVESHAIIIDDLLRDFEDPKSGCATNTASECESRLLDHVRRIESKGVKSLQSALIHARILVHQGKVIDAAQWLSKRCQDFTSDATCSTYLVDIAFRTKDSAMLEEASTNYLILACSTPDACAGAATWIGNLYMARGNYERALGRFERAANEVPSAQAWLRVAEAALSLGRVSRAQSAAAAARRLGASTDTNLERKIEQARREQLLHDALRH